MRVYDLVETVELQVHLDTVRIKHQSTKIDVQGDTGANALATNNFDIIHDYKPYNNPQSVGVFFEEEADAIMLTTVETGYILIVCDQGNIIQWKVVYTPRSNGTVLSPDNYH